MNDTNKYSNLISEEQRVLKVLNKVRNEIKDIEDGFKIDFHEEEKILYTLKVIKKGSLKEIKEFIENFDYSYKSTKAIKLIEQTCEKLLTDEKIGVVKIGKVYGYYHLIS